MIYRLSYDVYNIGQNYIFELTNLMFSLDGITAASHRLHPLFSFISYKIRIQVFSICIINHCPKPQVLGDRIPPFFVFCEKKNSPFFSFFLVFLWLTCAISSDKYHYFISSEKSHYVFQFTIQPLPGDRIPPFFVKKKNPRLFLSFWYFCD
jgi:hypothetical protein